MRCRECGRDTGDRHHICWRCRRGLTAQLLETGKRSRHDLSPLVCQCYQPRPVRVGGLWAAVGALQCERCGRMVSDG